MIILSNFVQFCTFAPLHLHNSKNFIKISDSFKYQKFSTPNAKVMAKDKKVNIVVT